MRRLLVFVLAMVLCVGLQANVAAQADDEDTGAPSASAQDTTKSDPAPAGEEPSDSEEGTSKDEPSDPPSEEPAAAAPAEEPEGDSDQEQPADGPKPQSEKPSVTQSATPQSSPAVASPEKDETTDDDAFEPYDVTVWWKMASVSDKAVWTSPQIYVGTSRPAATCEKTSYQIDSYNIENRADEDLLTQLKASGLSHAGQDSKLDPSPWSFETLQDPYLCNQKVTPVTPTVTQASCLGLDQYTDPTIKMPADTDLLSYELLDAETYEQVSTVEAGKKYLVRAYLSSSGNPKPVFADPLPDGWTEKKGYKYAEYPLELTIPECETAIPPEPEWVDECGPDNGHWEYTDGDGYTYTETTNDDGSITVTATPKEGYEFPEGTVTEWTQTDSEEECIVDAPPPPVWTDDCDVEGSWDVPADGDNYHFEVSAVLGGAQTVTLVADDGYAFPEGTVTEWSETDDAPECDLVPGDIAAECVSAVPYLDYEVKLPVGFTGDGPQVRQSRIVGANPVTITFVNPSGPDYVVKNQPLNGRILWPGASDVEPLQWPGWTQDADGNYVETDGNYAWTRDGVTVRFDVNPSFETTVGYPPASSKCANPPKKEGGPPPSNPPNPPVVYNPPPTTTTGLPDTGGTSLMEGVLGALMVLAGAVVLANRRKVRG